MPGVWTPDPHSALAQAVVAAGFWYDPDQDIIYSTMNPLQRRLGYAYGYDAAAILMAMIIDCEPIFFDYDNKHWMIELWKGQYGLETGCEVGVYTRPIGSSGVGYDLADATIGRRPADSVPSHNLFYDCASDSDRLTLSATLNRDGQKLFTLGPELHWWLTGFKWGVYSDTSQLTVDVSITLKDDTMLQAFQGGIAGRNYPNMKVNGTTVSFTFDKTYATQPPKPGLAEAQAWDQQIVNTYNQANPQRKNNDPNQVQAEFFSIVSGLLHLPDGYGQTITAAAIDAGVAIATILSGVVAAIGAAASAVESWWGGLMQTFGGWVSAVEQYLGINLDYACYVEIDNRNGRSAMLLKGTNANQGQFLTQPPFWIPKGKVARFVLSDPKGSVHGSDGGVTYSYTDANLNAKTVEFRFEDPVGFWNSNQASASQADWVTWGRTSTSNPWSTNPSDYSSPHPFYVGYVIGGGQPS
jgi:hypothetical protein